MTRLPGVIFGAVMLACAGCGAGSSTGQGAAAGAPNVQAVKVYAGPAGNYTNGAFTSVTVCLPGSATNCQTIDGVLVDSGSSGLRLLSSYAGGALTLALPQLYQANGNPLAECAQYADLSYTWGSVQKADVRLAGEVARSVPINVLGDPNMPPPPAACAYPGIDNDNLQALGANGLLGVGAFQQDCGTACAPGNGTPPSAAYYECSPGSPCQSTFVSLDSQVQNPVALFAADNNGIILRLPDVAGPQPSAAGTLVFGIGTRSNNGLGSAAVFQVDSAGNFLHPVVYDNRSYVDGYIDSGSNGIYFNSNGAIPACGAQSAFYCPAATLSLSATAQAVNNTSIPVKFSVADADQLFSNPSNYVLPDLAGTNSDSRVLDWGLPFFFGRSVYVAIASKQTSAGTGPFWAY
ncbi:MAG TPA: DUF3443 family protein [Gammaproteobacteria bacterium]|nr:DUF3443 family protein [Gammaproteobacteria bacterium]